MSSDKIDSAGTIALRLSGLLTIEFECPVCQREVKVMVPAQELRDWPGVGLTCQICAPRDFEVYLNLQVDGHHRQLINP